MTRQSMNFQQVIRKSGLSKKEIASRKKIKPETLSRHLSGAIRMTLDDAYDYAEILGCTPQEIFYVQDALPVFIKNYTSNEENDPKWSTKFERVLQMENPDILYVPSYFHDNLAACVHVHRGDYEGQLSILANSVDVVLADPIIEGYVARSSYQAMSYVSVKNMDVIDTPRETTNILMMMVYPQPNNLYSLFNPLTQMQFEGVELNWATPVCAHVQQPQIFIPDMPTFT